MDNGSLDNNLGRRVDHSSRRNIVSSSRNPNSQSNLNTSPDLIIQNRAPIRVSDVNVNINTQSDKPMWYPRVLVLGPGGIKGFKTLGFLSPLEDSKFLEYIDTYCGVSVGAIIALLTIAGYQIREIVGEAAKFDIFKEIGNFNVQSIMSNKGLMSNEPVRRRLNQLILNKFGTIPTLHGLYMQTGKAFVTVTLNATDEECVMMGPFTHPNVSCVDATMFSMNVPFIFYQLVHHGKIYVDGALANPYPIDYFDDGKTNILGIYLKGTTKTPPRTNSDPPGPIIQHIESQPAMSVGIYFNKIFHSLIDQRRGHIIQQASAACRHVCLEATTNDTMGYGVNTDDKARMLVEGFNEGKLFLAQMQNNTYIDPKIPEISRYTYPPYYTLGETETSQEPINVLPSMAS